MATGVEDWEGQTVLDRVGEKIGTIEEIFLVEETGQPEWALVKIGRLKSHATLVPLTRASSDANGVKIAYEKGIVEDAPHVDPDSDPSEEQVQEIYRHYGIDVDGGQPAGAPSSSGNGAGGSQESSGPTTSGDYHSARQTGSPPPQPKFRQALPRSAPTPQQNQREGGSPPTAQQTQRQASGPSQPKFRQPVSGSPPTQQQQQQQQQQTQPEPSPPPAQQQTRREPSNAPTQQAPPRPAPAPTPPPQQAQRAPEPPSPQPKFRQPGGGRDVVSGSPDLRDEPIGDLLKTAKDEASTFVKKDLELAKAEMSVKAKEAGLGAGMFGGAGYFGHLAMLGVMLTVIFALATAMQAWLAALIVTVVFAAVAGALALAGKKKIEQAGPPVPEQAVEAAKQTIQNVKEEAKWGLGKRK